MGTWEVPASMQAADRRRYNAPFGSMPLKFAAATTATESSSAAKGKGKLQDSEDIIDEQGKRHDGRGPLDARPIFLKTGLVSNAPGSAFIETGRLKLIAAVYGPKPPPPSMPLSSRDKLLVDVRFAPFARRSGGRLTPGKETEAPQLASALQLALQPSILLEAQPRAIVELFITVLELDGPFDGDGDLAAAITAGSGALADAGTPLQGLTVGVSAAMLSDPRASERKDLLLVDPTYDELHPRSSSRQTTGEQERGEAPPRLLTFGFVPALDALAYVNVAGGPLGAFQEAFEACRKVAGD